MFRFNFHAEQVDHVDKLIDDPQDGAEEPCREIAIPDIHRECIFKSISLGNVEFFVRDLQREAEKMNEEFTTLYKDCDVIPAIYEGGLKVWECTYDLLSFLMTNDVDFGNKTVLDLGCGCGLLGIFAGMKEAKEVHFQDYNADVLNACTIPNVRKNNIKSVKKFFSGDWRNFFHSSFINGVEYDYILTSETLYNTNNYPKLFSLFTDLLKDDGEIFVASKSYYFGVGGSVREFQKRLNHYESLRWKTVWKTEEGVQREIFCIKKNS